MSKAALFNPKFVSYSKASQKSAHANGVYKVFPKEHDASTDKYSTRSVELNDTTLREGYVFFPGARIAFYTGPNWWQGNIKGKPLIQIAIETITGAQDVLERLTWSNGYAPAFYNALVAPEYADLFTAAVQTAYPPTINSNAAATILAYFSNLPLALQFFVGYDRVILENSKNIEAKRLSKQDAVNLLNRIRGITKKQTVIEGKPVDKPPKVVSATKLNYTKEDLLAESKAGQWFDISGAEIKDGAKVKGITKTQTMPQPDRHYFYTNPELPLNLYFPVKANKADMDAVHTRVANFMRVRNIPFTEANWKIGTYQYEFKQVQQNPVSQANTGMLSVLSNRPVPMSSQQPIILPSTNVAPAPVQQFPTQVPATGFQPASGFQPVVPPVAQPSVNMANTMDF